jgi:hypothetical protein
MLSKLNVHTARRSGRIPVYIALLVCLLSPLAAAPAPLQRWSAERAKEWYASQGWISGCDYPPATAAGLSTMLKAAGIGAIN